MALGGVIALFCACAIKLNNIKTTNRNCFKKIVSYLIQLIIFDYKDIKGKSYLCKNKMIMTIIQYIKANYKSRDKYLFIMCFIISFIASMIAK